MVGPGPVFFVRVRGSQFRQTDEQQHQHKPNMPPRPFPYPLLVGNDICRIDRIRKIITGIDGTKAELRPLTKFMQRLLTPPEMKYFWRRFSPEDIERRTDDVSQYLAGRFAAKEACRKACPHFDKTSRGFQQIMILPIASRDELQSARPQALILDTLYGTPEASEPGVAQEKPLVREILTGNMPGSLNGQICEISISHDSEYATAVAIVPEIRSQKVR
ncbi:hypothetical protein J1614_007892 [Plenodomus biglobosus]|nr:hypothetical protein J1614_007892 [Plenodomus biglobosus]